MVRGEDLGRMENKAQVCAGAAGQEAVQVSGRGKYYWAMPSPPGLWFLLGSQRVSRGGSRFSRSGQEPGSSWLR